MSDYWTQRQLPLLAEKLWRNAALLLIAGSKKDNAAVMLLGITFHVLQNIALAFVVVQS